LLDGTHAMEGATMSVVHGAPEQGQMSTHEPTMKRFTEGMLQGDFAAIGPLLAPDVTLNSPITASFNFRGADNVLRLLKIVHEGVDGLEYEQGLARGDMWAQFLRFDVKGSSLQGVELFRFDERGRISEMTLFFRPLPGLSAFAAAFAAPLGRRRGRLVALLLALLCRPLVVLTRQGDKLVARLLRRTWGSGAAASDR
jgi:hypothetical protein